MRQKLHLLIPTMRQGGGAARVFLYLCQRLNREWFDTSVVVLDHLPFRTPQLPDDIPVLNLDCQRARYAPTRIHAWLRRDRPDIVLSTSFRLDTVLGLVARGLRRRPRMVSRCINMPRSLRTRRAHFYLYRMALRRFDQVVCQSRAMATEVRQLCKYPAERVSCITNPVDARLVCRRASGDRPQVLARPGIRLVSVGRLEPHKHVDLLIQSLRLLSSEYSLVILGDGSQRAALQAMVRRLGLESRICFVGFQENPYPYLKHADLLVTASAHEGCPNAVIEAMICGTPVVCVANEAVGDLVNAASGWIVPERTPAALATALSRAAARPLEPQQIRDLARQRHDVESIVAAYEAVLLGRPVDTQPCGRILQHAGLSLTPHAALATSATNSAARAQPIGDGPRTL